MAKKLYVGGLPFSTTEEELKSIFSQHGQVSSAKIITDKYTGQSRGFGFVEMPNDDEANAAIQKMNGSDVGGRKCTVNEARPMEKSQRFDRGDRGGHGGYGKGKGGRGGFNRW
ncbi:MAG: RNA-binding protein [Elusimicrobia bacterium]|nr:RNA-binding protein [Elusimicrobiota bacterium]